jgi:hypothetical protein
VTPRQGRGIEPQDPTVLRPLRAAEAHGREHPADSLASSDQRPLRMRRVRRVVSHAVDVALLASANCDLPSLAGRILDVGHDNDRRSKLTAGSEP